MVIKREKMGRVLEFQDYPANIEGANPRGAERKTILYLVGVVVVGAVENVEKLKSPRQCWYFCHFFSISLKVYFSFILSLLLYFDEFTVAPYFFNAVSISLFFSK